MDGLLDVTVFTSAFVTPLVIMDPVGTRSPSSWSPTRYSLVLACQ